MFESTDENLDERTFSAKRLFSVGLPDFTFAFFLRLFRFMHHVHDIVSLPSKYRCALCLGVQALRF